MALGMYCNVGAEMNRETALALRSLLCSGAIEVRSIAPLEDYREVLEIIITWTKPVIEPTKVEIKMAIARITAVGDSDWTIGVGSIWVIE